MNNLIKAAHDHRGEAWLIEESKNQQNIITTGTYKGMNISDCYNKHREYFNTDKCQEFPFALKVVKVSKRINPCVCANDDYAIGKYNDVGASKFWYIINSSEKAKIIYGSNIKDKEELSTALKRHHFNKTLNKFQLEPHDFYYIEPGCIHGIDNKVEFLEIISHKGPDFDIDRCNKNMKASNSCNEILDVVSYEPRRYHKCKKTNDLIANLVTTKDFCVHKVNVDGKIDVMPNGKYMIGFTLDNHIELTVDDFNYTIRPNQMFLITANSKSIVLEGDANLLIVQEEYQDPSHMFIVLKNRFEQ